MLPLSGGSEIMNKFVAFLKKHLWDIIAIAIAIVMFVVDIVTKQVMIKYFATHSDPIVLIPGIKEGTAFLQINYVINTAAAFGFGIGSELVNRIVYCVIAGLALGGIIFFFIYKNKAIKPFVKVTLLLIASGALGNLIDRIFYSPEFLHYGNNGVVDWIDFAGIWAFVFNIADSCVVVGAIMMIVWLIVDEVKEVKKKRNAEVAENGGKVLSVEEQSRLEENQPEEPAPEEEKPEEETQKELES